MIRFSDGYERRAIAHGVRVNYRPATMRERDRLAYIQKKFCEDVFLEAVFDHVVQHLVASDLGLSVTADRIRALSETQPDTFGDIFKLIQGQVPDGSGERWVEVEQAYQQNLFHGVILQEMHPQIAARPCDDCRKWWFLDNGTILTQMSTGLKQLRVGPPACETEIGCPKGTWQSQKTLNKSNRWCYNHFRECEAVRSFPPDDIVKTNSIIIRRALAVVERLKAKKAA